MLQGMWIPSTRLRGACAAVAVSLAVAGVGDFGRDDSRVVRLAAVKP
jgi:hypothetical protein